MGEDLREADGQFWLRKERVVKVLRLMGDEKALQLALDNNKLGTEGINAQNELGETPFLLACRHGSSQTAVMLMKLGVDPTLADNLGKNALHAAAEKKGNEEVLQLLPCLGMMEDGGQFH